MPETKPYAIHESRLNTPPKHLVKYGNMHATYEGAAATCRQAGRWRNKGAESVPCQKCILPWIRNGLAPAWPQRLGPHGYRRMHIETTVLLVPMSTRRGARGVYVVVDIW